MRFESEVFIKWQKDIDNAIFGEIKQKAIENGIRTEYALNEKFIISALEKQIPKKVTFHKSHYRCPSCNDIVIGGSFCKYCGQAILWGG